MGEPGAPSKARRGGFPVRKRGGGSHTPQENNEQQLSNNQAKFSHINTHRVHPSEKIVGNSHTPQAGNTTKKGKTNY